MGDPFLERGYYRLKRCKPKEEIETRSREIMRDKLYICVLTVSVSGITLLHNMGSMENPIFLNITQKLYYLPIILGAYRYGIKGALPISVISTFLYPHHGHTHWPDQPFFALNQYAEMFMFNLIGVTTGFLSDIEKRTQKKYESTASELKEAYEKLQDSFEQIRRADRLSSLGILSAGVAHEIRNPLSSIKGSIEILEDDYGKKEKKYEFIQIIKKEIKRLDTIISEFLTYAKPVTPQIDDNSVNDIVKSVVKLVGQSAEINESNFKLDLDSNLQLIRIDSEQVKQALLNIILNGIQAADGKITIETGTQRGNTYISVKDSGPGIPEENLNKLFDPFFTTKESGIGLGLSITLQIIQAHGGDIQVSNRSGGGSKFTIILPIKGNEQKK